MTYHVYIDGASRGNPGNAAIGVLIKDSKENIISEISECVGIATNNQAEYKALIKAFEALGTVKENITVYTDSQLLERQWKGIYKVKNPEILKLYANAVFLAGNLKVKIVNIPREKNKEADALANKALDQEEIKSNQNRGLASKLQLGTVLPPKASRTVPNCNFGACPLSEPANGGLARKATFSEEENFDIKPQRSAGGVVYKFEGSKVKVLLIAKKDSQVWALPKGRIEPGENYEHTAKREIAEETGFNCDIKGKIDEVSYSFLLKEENTLYNKEVVFYLMHAIGGQGKRDSEADEVKWFTIGDAVKKLTYLSEKKVLEKAKGLLAI